MAEISNMVVTVTGDVKDLQQKMNDAKVSVNSLTPSIAILNTKLDVLKTALVNEKNIEKIKGINTNIQSLEGQIGRLTNVGKAGFDSLGNAIEKTGSPLTKAYSGLRQLANVLPGIGIGGLVAFAVGPILDYVEGLNLFGSKTKEEKENAESLAKSVKGIFETSGKEATEASSLIAILKNEAETRERKNEALKELKKLNPEIFGQLKLEGGAVEGLDTAYKNYLISLKNVIAAKIVQAQLEQKITALLALEDKTSGKVARNTVADPTKLLASGKGIREFMKDAAADAISTDKDAKKLNDDIERLNQRLQDLSKFIKLKGGETGGGAAKKEVETVADVLAQLARELDFLSTKELIFHTDEAKAKVSAIDSTIQTLIKKFKLGADNAIVLRLLFDIEKINLDERIKQQFKGEDSKIELPFEITFENQQTAERIAEKFKTQFANALQNETPIKGISSQLFNEKDFDDQAKIAFLKAHGVTKAIQDGLTVGVEGLRFPNLDKLFVSVKSNVERLAESIGSTIKSTLADSLAGIGETIGNALVGKGNVGQIFGGFLSTIADGLKQMGKALIEFGIAKKIIQTAALSPGVAIAGGIALTIFAAALKASLPKFATGGHIKGPGTKTSDSIPAMLSRGEYVIKAATVDRFGVSFFNNLNKGVLPKQPATIIKLAQGGQASKEIIKNSVQDSSVIKIILSKEYFKDNASTVSNQLTSILKEKNVSTSTQAKFFEALSSKTSKDTSKETAYKDVVSKTSNNQTSNNQALRETFKEKSKETVSNQTRVSKQTDSKLKEKTDRFDSKIKDSVKDSSREILSTVSNISHANNSLTLFSEKLKEFNNSESVKEFNNAKFDSYINKIISSEELKEVKSKLSSDRSKISDSKEIHSTDKASTDKISTDKSHTSENFDKNISTDRIEKVFSNLNTSFTNEKTSTLGKLVQLYNKEIKESIYNKESKERKDSKSISATTNKQTDSKIKDTDKVISSHVSDGKITTDKVFRSTDRLFSKDSLVNSVAKFSDKLKEVSTDSKASVHKTDAGKILNNLSSVLSTEKISSIAKIIQFNKKDSVKDSFVKESIVNNAGSVIKNSINKLVTGITNLSVTKNLGSVVKLATGGFVRGPGSSRSDSIPAMLSNGEYIINAASASRLGRGFLDRINNGFLPIHRADGGSIGTITGISSGQQVGVTGEFILRNDVLVAAVKRGTSQLGRTG